MKQLIYIILLTSAIWLTSCRSIQYVPVESVRTEVQYKDRLQRDSIHILDSVFMLVKGDTVFRDRYRVVYKDKLIRDTAYIHKVDSVQVPYSIEKKLTKWQSLKLELGGWAFGVIIVFGLVIIGWLVCRLRKK